MTLPDRLKIEQPTKQAIAEMTELCHQIENKIESFGEEEAADLIQRWNDRLNTNYTAYEFLTYWKAMSVEQFVEEALVPPPAFDTDLTFKEAHEVLTALMKDELPEYEQGYYLIWLEMQFPDANLNDLIYWPDAWFSDVLLIRDSSGQILPESELSPDQILKYAMLKQRRDLSGAPEDITLPFPMPD